MKKNPCFPEGVIATRNFLKCWKKLTEQQKQRAEKAIERLVSDHRYGSLKAHRVKSCPGKYECSISDTDRIIYAREGNHYVLHVVGKHKVIDHAHTRCFEEVDL